MEIIGIVLFQIVFIAGAAAILIFAASKLPKRELAQGSSNEPDFSQTLKNLVGKLPGLSESDRELGQNTGTFYTTAPISNVWERVIEVITRHPIHPNPRFQWSGFKADDAYHRLMMQAGWSDTQQYIGAGSASSFSTQINCTLTCTLSLEDLAGGGTALHFQYDTYNGTLYNFDLMAEKIKRATNERLRTMCLQMTQDPNRGMPF